MYDEQVRIYSKMPPYKRIEVAFSLHDFAYEHVLTFVKSKNPDKSLKEIQKLVTRRFLNESTDFF
jgi:hypothetical protein